MKLYEITGGYAQLQEFIESGEYEWEDLKDTLEALTDELGVKAEGIVRVLRNIKAEADAFGAESKRLADREKALNNKHDNLKSYLENCLKTANIKKLQAGLFTVSIQKNQASLKIADESNVPERFLVPQPHKVDKTAIKKALQDGEDLGDNFKLEQSESIRIK